MVVVAGGYPGAYGKGASINNLESAQDSVIFHSGTKLDGDRVLSNGGRVLAVSSMANTLEEALALSYKNIDRISFDKMYYRSDIGFDLK